MKKIILLSAALAFAAPLAGCGTTQGDRAAGGAAIGGATGALVGAAASGGRPGGVLAGAIVGAAAGGIIGANSAPPPPRRRCAEFDYDDYGHRVCVAWYNP